MFDLKSEWDTQCAEKIDLVKYKTKHIEVAKVKLKKILNYCPREYLDKRIIFKKSEVIAC